MRPVVEEGNGCFVLRAYDEVTNVATPDTVLPASRYGAKLFVPQTADIVAAARSLLGR